MKHFIFRTLLLLSILCMGAVSSERLNAQCPMCRMSAEADLKAGGTKAKGLNTGIMYMLSFPYILLGTIGFIWYRERRRVGEAEQLAELRGLLEPHDWKK
jgi:hypothetical protein